MHVYFSGIGGTGIGPLALIAHQAGFDVSGSDKQDSQYILYLKKLGLHDIHIGQSYEAIAAVHEKSPIDWFVHTSALPIENPDAPELMFCQEHGIKTTKRDEFINLILTEKKLKLIAIAGTHGKTTTTAMTIWLFRQLGIPVSYSVGAKIPFGEMGAYEPGSEYFVYEADEFDRNFLSFNPDLSLITGIDWDHPDIYTTREEYNVAFRKFLGQSKRSFVWAPDAARLGVHNSETINVIESKDYANLFTLPGEVNRQDAALVAQGVLVLLGSGDIAQDAGKLNEFPGVSRRFEQIAPNLYSDYAHTPPKIRGALQLAREVAGENVVVIYEGLHNTRQHFIKEELSDLFGGVKKLYIVPSYLAREDKNLELLSPQDLKKLMNPAVQAASEPAELNEALKSHIQNHLKNGDVVLCLSAGGGRSLDEWLRNEFPKY
jgi:UDP-N-acetylmuramate--alanine ligase